MLWENMGVYLHISTHERAESQRDTAITRAEQRDDRSTAQTYRLCLEAAQLATVAAGAAADTRFAVSLSCDVSQRSLDFSMLTYPSRYHAR